MVDQQQVSQQEVTDSVAEQEILAQWLLQLSSPVPAQSSELQV